MLDESQELTLSLRPRVNQPRLSAEGWLVLGASPREWLDVLLRAEADLEAFCGYVLPTSSSHRQPTGILVTAGLTDCPAISGRAYRRLGERLWLPCDAVLFPELSGHEVDGILHHHLAVFHPGMGLIGFEEVDRVGIVDLLGAAEEREANFSWAHPGLPLQDRLYAILAMDVPRVEILLEDVRESIGSEASEKLPKTPTEETETGIRHWRKQMKFRFFEALNKLAKKPRESEESKGEMGWKQRLESWTQDRLDALRRDQERELDRLLHLLRSNPDEGLKFALPLSGGSSRGNASEESALPERPTEFNLNRLRSGRSGSPWVMDWQKHYELSRQYREAANRELRLGRHRRAAYIYAELLKDYREAANVLRQGKHYREASVLYLKHLGDPLEGARCLREGGYLIEAIPILEGKKEHELAAELYAELGNDLEAARQYRFAVSRALAHGNTCKAALLLEKRLGCPEEAIELLQKAWPRSEAAVSCLSHELKLYERRENWSALLCRIDSVTADHPPNRAVGLMETLIPLARRSPHLDARVRAERSCFTVAGRWLGSPNFSESKAMLGLLRNLVPEDRLLIRDTARFLEQSTEAARRKAKALEERPSDGAVVLLESHAMPSWVAWQGLEPSGRHGFYALGTTALGLTLMRMRWSGGFQVKALEDSVVGRSLSQCHLVASDGALPEILSILGMRRLVPMVLPPSDAFANDVRVENPPWVGSHHFLGLAYGSGGVAWVLQRDGDEGMLSIASYSAMGDLIATRTLRLPIEALRETVAGPVPMISTQEQIVFMYGRYLVRFYRDQVDCLEMREIPNRLHFASLGRLQLAASYDVGAEIFWGDRQRFRRCLLDLPVNDPCITFTRTGDVLALSRDRLDWLGYQRGVFVPLHMESLSGFENPMGIYPTDTPNVYAMVNQREVRLIRVTPWKLGK